MFRFGLFFSSILLKPVFEDALFRLGMFLWEIFVISLMVLYIKSLGRFFMGSSLMSSVISRILASIRPLHGRPIVKHSFARSALECDLMGHVDPINNMALDRTPDSFALSNRNLWDFIGCSLSRITSTQSTLKGISRSSTLYKGIFLGGFLNREPIRLTTLKN